MLGPNEIKGLLRDFKKEVEKVAEDPLSVKVLSCLFDYLD